MPLALTQKFLPVTATGWWLLIGCALSAQVVGQSLIAYALAHLPATLMSAAVPPMLYGIGKQRWGSAAGAIAAAGYVLVPIAVGFSNFWNLETVCIFGAVLFFWGHSRHLDTGKRRHQAASLAGLVVACAGDWVGILIVTPTLACWWTAPSPCARSRNGAWATSI